jgi:DNA-binding NtrC family response regulator
MPNVDRVHPAETEGTASRRTAARVLAVDDEPSALKLLSLVLSTSGFHCATFPPTARF